MLSPENYLTQIAETKSTKTADASWGMVPSFGSQLAAIIQSELFPLKKIRGSGAEY